MRWFACTCSHVPFSFVAPPFILGGLESLCGFLLLPLAALRRRNDSDGFYFEQMQTQTQQMQHAVATCHPFAPQWASKSSVSQTVRQTNESLG